MCNKNRSIFPYKNKIFLTKLEFSFSQQKLICKTVSLVEIYFKRIFNFQYF